MTRLGAHWAIPVDGNLVPADLLGDYGQVSPLLLRNMETCDLAALRSTDKIVKELILLISRDASFL